MNDELSELREENARLKRMNQHALDAVSALTKGIESIAMDTVLDDRMCDTLNRFSREASFHMAKFLKEKAAQP